MARSSSLLELGAVLGASSRSCFFQREQRLRASDLNATSLAETARLAADHQAGFEPIEANIADRHVVERLPGQVRARFGTADGVINNAGIIQPFVTVNSLDYAAIERVLNVNLMGTLYVTKAFLPTLLERPEAHIVNLSSMGGFVPVPGQTIYCAAKAGVKLLTEGLASELMHTNVRVTVVFPGAIATNITANSGVRPASTGAQHSGAIKPLPPGAAAEIIVKAMERNAHHVFVGRDSAFMNRLHRLSPTFAARMIADKMKGLLRN
jgi:short-subunit dehydrogenase